MKAQTEIREWVSRSGLKLTWVAAQVPASLPALSRWLSGKCVPSAVYRNRLAEISGIESIREEESWR